MFWGCLCVWFMTDMLDSHEDDEERPQRKKRKLSNSQENNQDINLIKVPALIRAFLFFHRIGDKLHIQNLILYLLRTFWFHSPHQSPSGWRELSQSYRLWMPHAKPLGANWTAWCPVPRALSRFLWLQARLRVPLKLGTKCDGNLQVALHHILSQLNMVSIQA